MTDEFNEKMRMTEAIFNTAKHLNISLDEIGEAIKILSSATVTQKQVQRKLADTFLSVIKNDCQHTDIQEFFKDVKWLKLCKCGRLLDPTSLEMLAITTLEKNGKVINDTITPRH